jgi:hypothetical protein
MRLALLGSVLTFAGSIAGFHLASAPSVSERAVAVPVSAVPDTARTPDDCPHRAGGLREEV